MDDKTVNSAWLIADPSAEAGAIETLPETPGLNVLTKEELSKKDLRFSPDDKLCITSEAVMDEVVGRLEDTARRNGIGKMKDKTAFRQLVQSIYPDFFFRQIAAKELPNLQLDSQRKYVVKPVKGCFGSGVRVIEGNADLKKLAAEIDLELQRNSLLFSDRVLSTNELIIEEYIEGEEYAVDMFYDSDGQPVITNIYHHPMPGNPAYLHMLYYTSHEVFNKLYDHAMSFFQQLNKLLNVSRLPIHSEFRLRDGELIPIELNSLRFGGMGLTNLGYYTLGINAYQCLIKDEGPDWQRLWEKNREKAFGFFIAYNGADIDVNTHKPDWPNFRHIFSKIVHEVPFDYQKQLAFGILYIEESQKKIMALLDTEFNEFFVRNG